MAERRMPDLGNIKCIKRIEHYLWPYSANDKLCEPLWSSKFLLFLYRLGGMFLSGYTLINSIILASRGGDVLVIYFEFWLNLYALVTYSLFVLNYFWNRFWRYGHFFYELGWTWSWVILIYYWCVLYVNDDHMFGDDYMDTFIHTAIPLLFILDCTNNKIIFFRRHIRIIFAISILILIMNCIYSYFEDSVYLIFNFKDPMTILWIAIFFLVQLISFVFAVILDAAKTRFASEKMDDLFDDDSRSSSYGSINSDEEEEDETKQPGV